MKDYIQPTKENPVFSCSHSYFGYIEDFRLWKDWIVEYEDYKGENTCLVGSTWAINLPDAISRLFDYIKENRSEIPADTKFKIEMITGDANKWGDVKRQEVYSISMKQAVKFKVI